MIQGTGDDLGADDDKEEGASAWLTATKIKGETMIDLLPTQLELLNRTA